MRSRHIYADLNAFHGFCNDYGIREVRTRYCASRKSGEIIPNVFLIWD